MSQCEINLCSRILKECFGDVVQNVGVYLARKGSMPLGLISQGTGLKIEQVKPALRTLLQQNIVSFQMNKKCFVEYRVNVQNVLLRPRFPRYIYLAKMLYGDVAELLVEELLHNGQLHMSEAVKKVTERLKEGEEKATPHQVREKFSSLARTHFIKRCPAVDDPKDTVTVMPNFSSSTHDLYTLPAMDVDYIEGRKRKHSEGDAGNPAKKIKLEGSDQGTLTDEGIYWTVNYERFNLYLRDQAVVNAAARKIDKCACEVVRAVLRLSEVNTEEGAAVTNPSSYNDIYTSLPKELGITRQSLEQYLKLLVEDSISFLTKVGDSGGGMYIIHFGKAMAELCKAHMESVVQERFGSKCLRIFRLLLMKKQLEQKQIEEFAMIPAKEAKELLYRMFGEQFVALTEVPKTPDHAPSRTFYLFSVDLKHTARMLLERCFKTMYNLISRREHETRESKRLLEKQQRVEAIAASLEQNGADATQKEEIEEMITPSERAQLGKVKHMTNKLEQSELQLDDTIFILQTYLLYANVQ